MNDDKPDEKIDFELTIRNMGRMNAKIKLITELQRLFRGVSGKYALFVDTESNMHLTHEERT